MVLLGGLSIKFLPKASVEQNLFQAATLSILKTSAEYSFPIRALLKVSVWYCGDGRFECHGIVGTLEAWESCATDLMTAPGLLFCSSYGGNRSQAG